MKDEGEFYDSYEPAPKVNKRINDEKDDSDLKAPYRDILGIFDSFEAWSPEDAIKANRIKQEITEWETHHRDRNVGIPSRKTIRNQLNELEEKGLVVSKKEGKGKSYWKHPDDEIESPIFNRIVSTIKVYSKYLERVTGDSGVILASILIYCIGGSFLLADYLLEEAGGTGLTVLSLIGARTMIAGMATFVIVHILMYIDRVKIVE